MDPQRLLRKMCDRHGLPYADADRLKPLVERALQSPDTVRDRILTLVEKNLAQRNPNSDPARSSQDLMNDLDDEVLAGVAKVLHNWSPSGKVLDVGGALPNLFPNGIRPEDLDE